MHERYVSAHKEYREMEYKPLESYICTLPEDCIIIDGDSDALPAKQSSLTANSFSIKEQCMKSLLAVVANYEVIKELNAIRSPEKIQKTKLLILQLQ